ncbi:MAG TPA: hypothetical protein VHP63_07810 [candidate division Zixibacteria bacterium]|nr:hypothetical protein [candidate division Zixibacteria bacterium]
MKVGDHPFIKQDTCVNYPLARVFDKKDLTQRIERRDFGIGKPFSDQIVALMRDGIMKSEFTPNHIRTLCERALNDPDNE